MWRSSRRDRRTRSRSRTPSARRRPSPAQHPDARVLGVDTLVAVGPTIYGKPADCQSAGATLRALAGRGHVVVSGVCVIEAGRARHRGGHDGRDVPRVRRGAARLVPRQRRMARACRRLRDPGPRRALVAGIEGDYLNVVGLPVMTLLELAPDLLPRRLTLPALSSNFSGSRGHPARGKGRRFGTLRSGREMAARCGQPSLAARPPSACPQPPASHLWVSLRT